MLFFNDLFVRSFVLRGQSFSFYECGILSQNYALVSAVSSRVGLCVRSGRFHVGNIADDSRNTPHGGMGDHRLFDRGFPREHFYGYACRKISQYTRMAHLGTPALAACANCLGLSACVSKVAIKL